MRKYGCMTGIMFSIFLFTAIPASANSPSENDGWHMGDGWHMMDFRGGDIFMWFILLIVVGVMIYLLVNRSSNQRFFTKSEETPLDIIKRRYANGEITREEYEQMKQDLL